MIPLASWEPDRSRFDPEVSDSIVNAIPRVGGYGPVPQLTIYSNALPAAPKGAIFVRGDDGGTHIFAGTTTKLYRLDTATLNWTDKSGVVTFAVPTDDHWSFAKFGNWLIATNKTDGAYYFDLATPAGNFAVLGGTPPNGRVAGVIGDFLFLGELSTQARGIRWSGINDPAHWTIQKRLAGDQIFPDGDEITGIVGFERGGLIFQRRSIREAIPALNTPLVFRFQKVEENRGAISPSSIVSVGRSVFYLFDDGFYAFGAENPFIGAERVNRYFIDDLDPAARFQVQGAADPVNHTVWWRYKSTAGASSTYTDKVIGYHYTLNKWFRVDVNLSWLFTVATPGYTLDTLDSLGYTLDTLPFSLDSRTLDANAPLLGGFTSDFKLGFFSGPAMEATLQTGDADVVQAMVGAPNIGSRRAFVRGFTVISDAETVHGRVASASRHGGNKTWTPEATASTVNGVVPVRTSGRLHRFELRIPAGQDWDYVHGVVPDARPEGIR